jgi:putative transposase
VLCRVHGIISAAFYKRHAKFGGMDASLLDRLRELEDENRRLKKIHSDERLKAKVILDDLGKE